MKLFLVTILTFGLQVFPAVACSYNFPKLNKPIKYQKNCAFENAGKYNFGSGEPAEDLGNGRVSQIMSDGVSQGVWLVADCNQKAFSVVIGKYVPIIENGIVVEDSCGPYSEIKPFLKEGSKLRAAAERGLTALEKIAMENSHEIGDEKTLKLEAPIIASGTIALFQRPVKPMCGCKIFYPDSAGANL